MDQDAELAAAKMITLDLESRSRIDLRECGQYKYAEDPSTQITLIFYQCDDGPVRTIDLIKDPDVPVSFVEAISTKVVASWGSFDYVMLNTTLLKPRGLELKPQMFYDISGHSLMLTFNRSLEQACLQLELPATEEKSGTGRKLIQVFCFPKEDGTFVDPTTRPEDWAEFIKYGARDVVAARACYHALRSIARWSKAEHQVYIDTLISNDLGIPVDMGLVEHALIQLDTVRASVMERFTALTQIDSMFKYKQMVEWCCREGFEIDSVRQAVIDTYMRSGDPIPENVRRMFEIKQEAPKAAVNKYKKIKLFTSQDNRLRGMLIYHGAATGRFTGNGPQIQNLARTPSNIPGTKKPWPLLRVVKALRSGTLLPGLDPHLQLKSAVRPSFRTRDGETEFIVSDFSQVEQRYLAYVAGCQTFLDVYRRASDPNTPVELRDPYILFAMEWLGAKTYAEAKALRSTAKVVILGCGYSLGPLTFLDYAKTYGLEITEQTSEDLVRGFRKKYPEIPRCWNALQEAVVEALQDHSVVRVLGHTIDATDPRAMSIRLLSGRRLWYRGAALEVVKVSREDSISYKRAICYEERDPDTGVVTRKSTYGGKLTENIIQAGCRDLLVDAVRRCREEGLKVVGTVHDEVIVEETLSKVKTSRAKLAEIMSTPPSWCPGLPLAAKSYVSRFYKKD